MENKVLAAYCAAWRDVKNPPLDSSNPHFRNRYASLSAVLKVVREACAPHGIVYRQHLQNGRLTSYVANGEDELRLSEMFVKEDAKSQEVGSDLTYRKRQLACLDWGIVGEDDDDAEGGSDYSPVPQQQPDALAAAWQRCLSLGVKGDGIKEHMRASFGKEAISQLSQAERMQMLQYLNGLAEDKQRLQGGVQ